eukprot:SAG22_NODE_2284_length_2758_cov_2.590071_2_plen_284_part_00
MKINADDHGGNYTKALGQMIEAGLSTKARDELRMGARLCDKFRDKISTEQRKHYLNEALHGRSPDPRLVEQAVVCKAWQQVLTMFPGGKEVDCKKYKVEKAWSLKPDYHWKPPTSGEADSTVGPAGGGGSAPGRGAGGQVTAERAAAAAAAAATAAAAAAAAIKLKPAVSKDAAAVVAHSWVKRVAELVQQLVELVKQADQLVQMVAAATGQPVWLVRIGLQAAAALVTFVLAGTLLGQVFKVLKFVWLVIQIVKIVLWLLSKLLKTLGDCRCCKKRGAGETA